jgi:C4-dicarboxylate transporter DctQ subunit
MAYGVRVGSHIGVDAVVKLLGPRIGRVVTIIATILCIVYAGLVLTGSWTYITKIYQIGNEAKDIAIPIWIPRLALPIGFVLLTYRFCEVLYRSLTGKTTHLIGDEAEEALKLRVTDDTSTVPR